MHTRLALCFTAVALTSCRDTVSRASFGGMAEEFVHASLALSPVAATAAGYHKHNGVSLDQLIDDYSPAGLQEQRRFYSDFRNRMAAAFKREQLTPEDRADYDIIDGQISLALLEYDTLQSFKHNPTSYVELVGNALYSPFVLEYASKRDRFGHIVSRLEKIPALVEQAKVNLTDSPDIWLKVALEENQGNIDLIDKTLRPEAPGDLKSGYDQAAGRAIVSLNSFNVFLRDTLSKHFSDWRLGKEKYARKFQLALGTGKTPEQMLAEADEKLKEIRGQMASLAKPQTVEAALAKVAARHATPETYMSDAQHDLAETTDFVREKHLLTLPARSNLKVIDTPAFMRGIYAVGGFSPAPALEPQLGAFYWITPIPKQWEAPRIESKLREYNYYGLKILTIHEAMPGHYVQAEYANDIQPKSRRTVRGIFGNGPYVEGWAVYATQAMIDDGYRNTPEMKLTFWKQMLRVVSNTILDIRLQTMGMTEQQAIDLMINDTYQEREEATAKYRRARLSSCQLPTYFAGWQGWLDAREAYKKAKGANFQLADFHERALKEGAVPLPALTKLLTP